jgi:peptidylprolyl isomerase
MIQAKCGDTVKVHYTGRLDDGTEFDSSRESSPLEFTIGKNEVIPGFENAVIGMTPGETKTITIIADDAYGQYNEEIVTVAEREQFPENTNPEVGQKFEMINESEASVVMTVVDITDSQVTLDGNHPLAGEDLTFDIELIEIA